MILDLAHPQLLALDPNHHHHHLPERPTPNGFQHAQPPTSLIPDLPNQVAGGAEPVPLAGASQSLCMNRQRVIRGRMRRMMIGHPSIPRQHHPHRVTPPTGHSQHPCRGPPVQHGETPTGPLQQEALVQETSLTESHRALVHQCQGRAMQPCRMAFYSLA